MIRTQATTSHTNTGKASTLLQPKAEGKKAPIMLKHDWLIICEVFIYGLNQLYVRWKVTLTQICTLLLW